MSKARPHRLERSFCLALALGWAVSAVQAFQAPSPAPQAVNREQMWPAPTAEDWKKPCLITWQRSYEDALAVARETKQPILVCVNMDGEIASEHYAGVRYRQPEIAKLYAAYTCVIASVYRHNPRDHDEQGRRILCPRFGSVTCGEHIAIEPGVFDKFLDGKRIAPRHIGVETDGQELYDVYYAWDTDTIFNSLKDGVADRPPPEPIPGHADRSLSERVASPDIEDRIAVEGAYQQGDHVLRLSLIQSAAKRGDTPPLELLRLAVFGFDTELQGLARQSLARSAAPDAVDLIAESLRAPMETEEREALVKALERLGASSPRARALAVVYRGLDSSSSSIDVTAWSKALSEAPPPAVRARPDLEALASAQQPKDAQGRLALAESYLATAQGPATERRYQRVLLEDAQRAAIDARQLGLSGPRIEAALALSAYGLGDFDEARAHAEGALNAPRADPSSWSTMVLLGLFAEARRDAITKAVREKQDWPAQWVADVHAAYSVLARHPFGTDAQVAAHHDFLDSFGAAGVAAQVLEEGLTRFPASWMLHERLRARLVHEKGPAGLESAYEAWLRRPDAPAGLESFAGYAALVAAEYQRRAGAPELARGAYERGIAHYQRAKQSATNPESQALCDHFVALALAGRARLDYEAGQDERALAEILACFERKPEAAASLDGLNITPVDTARMLLARLAARPELAAKLQAALDRLPPEMLLPPAYERDVRSNDSRTPRRRRAGTGR